MSCIVFATSSKHWGFNASVLMMFEPLAFETSKWVQYVGSELFVTLYRWPEKQRIPLSVLVRNQTKGFWT